MVQNNKVTLMLYLQLVLFYDVTNINQSINLFAHNQPAQNDNKT